MFLRKQVGKQVDWKAKMGTGEVFAHLTLFRRLQLKPKSNF